MLGIVRYDSDGKIVCPICSEAFHRLICHIRQKHGMTGKEFREKFGFCRTYAFISEASRKIARERVYKHSSKCIRENLINRGRETRFPVQKTTHIMTPQRLLLLQIARDRVTSRQRK